MTAVPVQQRMTADEFLAITEGEGPRGQELVSGEVIVHEPSALHNYVIESLMFALSAWTRSAGGGGRVFVPLDVKLDELNVFAPDLSWYSTGHVPRAHDPPPYPCPDLVIEARSPSTWRYDVGAKKAAYERHGLTELWLADTKAEEVLVFRRSRPSSEGFDVALELGVGEELGSPLLPGFRLALDELFDLTSGR